MIVFASRTGNVRYIVNQLDLSKVEIEEDLVMNSDYILFTYTDGLGNVPEKVECFLSNEDNVNHLSAVVASGNVNFGDNYCGAGYKISKKYNVPLLATIDLRGSKQEIKEVENKIKQLME